MTPAVRFLLLIVGAWGMLRFFIGGAVDPLMLTMRAEEAPRARPTPFDPFAPPRRTEPLAMIGPAQNVAPMTAAAAPVDGAILTPQGWLVSFETMQRLMGRGGAPTPTVAARATAPRLAAAQYPQATPPPLVNRADLPLIGYRLGDGSPLYGSFDRPTPPTFQARPATGMTAMQSPALVPPRPLDRWQFSAWAFARPELGSGGGGGGAALGTGATLGGDQAGARLTYHVNDRLSASARYASATGALRGDEVALGVRYRPDALPMTLTLERRQSLGTGPAARSAFAAYAETGIWQDGLPLGLRLEGYAQAGAVGVTSPDLFADGALTLTQPFGDRLAIGAGVWGGMQQGAQRLDIGPRATVRLADGLRLHADYRQRVAGDAQPASGPAITLGMDL